MFTQEQAEKQQLKDGDLVRMKFPIVSMRCVGIHSDRGLVQFSLADGSRFYGHWPIADLIYAGPG